MSKRSVSRFASFHDEETPDYPPPSVAPAAATPQETPAAPSAPVVVGKATGRGQRKIEAPVARASRAGRVGIQVWVDPSKRKKLKHYSADTGRSVDDFVNEAIDDFMVKHKIA